MKFSFTQQSVLTAAVLAGLVLATAHLTTAQTPTSTGDSSGNQNPTPAACCSCIAFPEEEAGAEGGEETTIDPEEDGSFKYEVTPEYIGSASSEPPCDDPISATITATLEVDGVAVDDTTETKSVSISSSGDTPPVEFTLTADQAKVGAKWKFVLDCTDASASGSSSSSGSTTSSGSEDSACDTLTVTLGGCEDCESGSCDTTGEPSASSGSFTVSIPTTQAAGGMTKGSLDFHASTFANPGLSALRAKVPSSFTVVRTAGVITSVATGAATILVAPADSALLVLDPKAFTITHKDLAGTIFRTTTISLVTEGGVQRFRMDSTFDGSTTRHEQTQPQSDTFILEKGRVVAGAFQSLRQDTLVKNHSTPGIRIHRRTLKDRATAAAAWATTSDIESRWENLIHGWEKTKEIIDPSGAALTSTWTYYQPGEPTGPGAATQGLGRLKHHVSYDGSESFHTYGLNVATVTTPFAGQVAAQVKTTTWNPVTKTKTSITTVNGNTVSKTLTAHAPAKLTQTVHTSAGQTLVTTTDYKPSGQDFGGKPLRTLHPDGTLTTYAYTRNAGGGFTTITANGATTDQTTVSLGTQNTTVTNSRGTTILNQTTAIGYGTGTAVFASMAVTAVDNLGRALTTAHFPATATVTGEQASATSPKWTTATEYSCCGVAKETDMYGIPTFHAYDHLQRLIKTNTLGVTIETVRNGRTTDTHRYAETISGALSSTLAAPPANLVSRSVSNLSGTLQESWSPDPTSAIAGTLIKSSSTATTYKPAAGLSTRSITTTPDTFFQTTDSFLDGRTYKTYGDLSPAMEYSYAVNATGPVNIQSFVDGANLRETTTSQSDWAGRTARITNMDAAFATMEYNPLGQMVKSTDPDGVVSLSAYNAEGESSITAIDLNLNGEIDFGEDTVSSSQTDPALDGSNPVMVTVSKVWQPGDTNPAAGTTTSTSTRSANGLSASSRSLGVPSTSMTVLSQDANGIGTGAWTTTSTRPDGSSTVTTYKDGLLDISENFDSVNNPISSTSMRDATNASLSGYDTLKRPTHQRDSRTGVTATAYLSATADIVKSMTDPGNRTTSFIYDLRGRRTEVDAPNTLDSANNNLLNITTTHYFPDGSVQETTGGQTYRVTYTYDYADRQKTMTTYGTETATTTWIYSPDRGFLVEKNYPGETDNGITDRDYTHTAAGRLFTRTWERGVLTTYGYDDGGRLETVTYSNETNGHTTPYLVNTYDALGRLRTVTRGGVLHAEYTYRPGDLQRLAEIQQIDTLNQAVTYTYEDGTNGTLAGRPNGYTSIHASATWTYDEAGRLHTVSGGGLQPPSPANTFTYGYRYTLNSGLHEGVITPGQGTESLVPFTLDGPKVDTTLAYEITRNALAFRRNDLTGGTLSKFAYGLNDLGQRVGLTPTGSAFANTTPLTWGYNGRGELTATTRSGNTAFERAYSFDGIGNRLTATDHNAALTSYFADAAGNNTGGNALNQYGRINYPGSSMLQPVHDDDGNMTSGPVPGADGLLPGVPVPANAALTWDAENRLVKAVVNSTTVHYAYDHQSRLISRSVGVSPTTFTRYLYHGWNRIAEYESNGSGHTLKSTYLWGMDLSGTMQGAGGVGGLLSFTAHGSPITAHFYPTYDGNGNVSEYVDDNGDKAAHFEYDPFGNLTVDSENNAGDFPYRFSTKPQDSITGLLYYTYRWYDPLTGRWPSRDPIEEKGGVNLYGFVGNDGANVWDLLGRLPEKFSGDGEFVGGQKAVVSEGATAITIPDYRPRVEAKGCGVKTSGELKVTINYKGTEAEFNKITDAVGTSLLEHENEHVEIYRKHWNGFVDDIQWMKEGPDGWFKVCSNDKAVLAAGYVIALHKYAVASAHKENCNLDQTHYLDNWEFSSNHANDGYKKFHDENCGNAGPELEKEKAAYEAARKAMIDSICP